MYFLLSGQAASRSTGAVDEVMLYITGISLLLLVGITITMIYFVFKYHRKKGHKPVDIHGNIWLEILWIGIPTILVLTMFYYGSVNYKIIRDIPENAFEIDAKARMWEWQFDYAKGQSTDTLYVPVDVPIKLNLQSMDVNHSLYIPAFRIKEDVVLGRENYLTFTAEKVGNYDIACAEYCGLKHSMMYTEVVVMPQEDFTKWYGDKSYKNVKDDGTDDSEQVMSSKKLDEDEMNAPVTTGTGENGIPADSSAQQGNTENESANNDTTK